MENLASYIDHALLRPEMTEEELLAGIRLAVSLNTASVCVRGCDLEAAREALGSSPVALGTVIGFPHGSQATPVKTAEIRHAAACGAVEVDAVIPVSLIVAQNASRAGDEMRAMVQEAHAAGALIKLIFENCLLSRDGIALACGLACEAGADFVKTSTGFGAWGARVEDVRLMRSLCPPHVGVKASGGIKTLEQAIGFIEAGATRVGTSSTQAILKDNRF